MAVRQRSVLGVPRSAKCRAQVRKMAAGLPKSNLSFPKVVPWLGMVAIGRPRWEDCCELEASLSHRETKRGTILGFYVKHPNLKNTFC